MPATLNESQSIVITDKIIGSGVMRLLDRKVVVMTGVTVDRFEAVEGFETKINPACSGRAVKWWL